MLKRQQKMNLVAQSKIVEKRRLDYLNHLPREIN